MYLFPYPTFGQTEKQKGKYRGQHFNHIFIIVGRLEDVALGHCNHVSLLILNPQLRRLTQRGVKGFGGVAGKQASCGPLACKRKDRAENSHWWLFFTVTSQCQPQPSSWKPGVEERGIPFPCSLAFCF